METSDQAPRSIGRYPILEVMGSAGTGTVYIAEDPRLQRKIAVKVLPDSAAGDPEALDRFKREGRVLAALNHPNIAKIHSFEEAERVFFLTMELVTGETLAQRLQAGPLPPLQALEITNHVASALMAGHAKGIFHGNLRCQNVMITPEDQVKVLDFGTKAAVGDPRSDIRGLGALVLECLTGDPEPQWDNLPQGMSDELLDTLKQCMDQPPESIGVVHERVERELGLLRMRASAGEGPQLRWPNNLPLQLSSFIGRRDDIETVEKLLGDTRLVTLAGIGGSGKTRLALEVARRLADGFPGGTWLVELGAIRDPNQVAQAVAQALKLRDERGRSLTETLLRSLEPKTTLLLMDSCEHLLSAVSQLASSLLGGAPNLRILATSREPLAAEGGANYSVEPLQVPAADDESVALSEAVQLFVKRASEAQPQFQLTTENSAFVAQICRRLDGIPLALELAATRVRAVSVEEINQRLDDRFRLLRGGKRTDPARLQTMRATMDWSYDLLSEDERKLFRTLSVYAGWTLDSASSVDGPQLQDLLSQLVQKSLVLASVPDEGQTRYRFLETVRQYGAAKLEESGEVEAARRLHAEYFISQAQEAETELRGPKQADWLEVMEADQENFLSAIDWCQSTEECGDKVFVLVRPLSWFWLVRGYVGFGRSMLSKVLTVYGGEEIQRPRAQLMDRSGLMARIQADYDAARSFHEESFRIYRKLGWRAGEGSALGNLANVAVETGDYDFARSKLEEALVIYREVGSQRGIATNLTNLAVIDNDQGRFESATARLRESMLLYSELGDTSSHAATLCNLGISLSGLGQLESGRSLIEESLGIYRELGEKISLAFVLEDLSRINVKMGNHLIAEMQLTECLSLATEIGEKQTGIHAVEGTAELAAAAEQPAVAVQLLAAAHALSESHEIWFPPRLAAGRDTVLESLRKALDDARFKEAWALGEPMSFESAVRFSLEWLSGVEPSAPSA